ncbi:MAG TPA: Sec-independent protein translocase TatA [Hyphomonadaceae bacterium]|nr:Sec-independent protein translocase TatA [Hyphomonadaceae bacterium]
MRDPLVIIVVLAVLLIFFGGRGKISSTMGDLATGIKNFRKGLRDGDKPEAPPQQLANEPINVTPEKDKAKTTT